MYETVDVQQYWTVCTEFWCKGALCTVKNKRKKIKERKRVEKRTTIMIGREKIKFFHIHCLQLESNGSDSFIAFPTGYVNLCRK